MRKYFCFTMILLASNASAQSISIISVEETANTVEILIETDMDTPFEVMAGVGLANQADNDVFIGNGLRHNITSPTQVLSVPAVQNNEALPTGRYDAEVNFYPRWGAESSPSSTKSITETIEATLTFDLTGSGVASSEISDRNELQRWVMLNTGAGEPFNLEVFKKRLGESEEIEVPNRNGLIVAHYFPVADMTLFENIAQRTLVTWKLGRESSL